MDTNPADLFEGVNACLLSPEVTEGPYCSFRNVVEYLKRRSRR